MLKRSFLVLGLVGCLATGAMADVMISYTSDSDMDPGTSDIDLNPGETATITIDLVPLAGETHVSSGGFNFAGANMGGGVVQNDTLTYSNFMFRESPFQDPNTWFTNNPLPSPATVAFFPPGAPLPVTAFATFTIEVAEGGGEYWIEQLTGPINFTDETLQNLPLTEDSGSFTVHVIPEPATLALLVLGGLTTLRRRR